jgi:MscS family membrane protein
LQLFGQNPLQEIAIMKMNPVMIILLAIISSMLFLPGVTAEPGGDFEDIMKTYNEETGDFEGFVPGDSIEFEDYVDQINYDGESYTEVWFRSTGSGPYDPSLLFVGDITKWVEVNDKIKVTVNIVERTTEENRTVEKLNSQVGSLKILKEGEEDKMLTSEKIDILGYKISLSGLPESLQTPWFKFGLVLFSWMVITVVLWLAFRLIVKIADRTKTDIDQKIINIVRVPFFIIVLLYGFILSVTMLDPPERILRWITNIYRAGVIILIAIIAVKIFKNIVIIYLKWLSRKTETQADDVLVPVLGKVVTVVIWIIAGILFLEAFGVDITVFVAGLGIAGLVIAFAAQDTLSNFFAGIMILLDRPFKEDDWILMDDKVYQVKHIGLRSTRLLHSFTNQIVTIPNNRISDHVFSNLNEPDYYGRTTVKVGVSYGADPRKVGAILLDEVKKHPDTFEDEDHVVFYRFNEFGDSALLFAVTFWIKDFNDQWRVSSELRESIFERFAAEDISIPFPQRVIHFASGPVPKDAKTAESSASGVTDMQNLSP